MVAEGAKSAVALDDLAHSIGMELPITHQVRAILYEGHDPSEAGTILMGRSAADELHGMDLVEDEG
jgi:glycerol-3-phosphate dehydrogenase (NAD(P)+)